MKYLHLYFIAIFCMTLAQGNTRLATVSGNVFLSDQSDDHSGVKILFTAVSGSATTDSVYSTNNGSYAIGLNDGIYSISFSKSGYIPFTLPNSYTLGNDTYLIEDVTIQAGSLLEVSGDISGIWSNNFQYRVTGDITIQDEDTLIIEPGTSILFMGDYTFNVNGSILAVGTEQDSIFITSGQPSKSPGDWGGIYISDNNDNDLKELEFSEL